VSSVCAAASAATRAAAALAQSPVTFFAGGAIDPGRDGADDVAFSQCAFDAGDESAGSVPSAGGADRPHPHQARSVALQPVEQALRLFLAGAVRIGAAAARRIGPSAAAGPARLGGTGCRAAIWLRIGAQGLEAATSMRKARRGPKRANERLGDDDAGRRQSDEVTALRTMSWLALTSALEAATEAASG